MATTEQLAQAEEEFRLAEEALNTARSAVLRAERRVVLAREAGPEVDPGLLAQVTQELETARAIFGAADAIYTRAQQNFQAVFEAVDDTAASQADPEVAQAEAQAQSQIPPLNQVQFQPGTVEIEEDQEGGAIGIPQDTNDTFAGDGYGFDYNEDGELIPSDSVSAADFRVSADIVTPDSDPAVPTGRFDTATADDIAGTDVRFEPRPPLNYSVEFEDGFGWVIVDNDTGSFVDTGFATQAEAQAALNQLRRGSGLTEEEQQEQDNPRDPPNTTQENPAQIEAARQRAQAQQAMARQRAQASQGDWRVKLRLAGAADYLYKSASPGIMAPLAVTDGVIFPYTPSITTGYRANYSSYDLTHSNYRGYFYTGSTVEPIQIQATFTAQDTAEADYVLAVIQFFRSVTKMFYGQDANRGVPPPLVFLQGLGQFQYNLHPCVVSSFNYTTPTDVDYIRAGVTTISGAGFLRARQRQTSTTPSPFGAIERLLSLGQNVKPGAQTQPPAPPTIGTQDPTYVPTKLDIQIELLPMQTRQQVSEQFSLDKFANGDLVKGGFW